MKIEYRIIQSTDVQKFVRLVNEQLSDGWKLAGNLVTIHDDYAIAYIQPIIKETK